MGGWTQESFLTWALFGPGTPVLLLEVAPSAVTSSRKPTLTFPGTAGSRTANSSPPPPAQGISSLPLEGAVSHRLLPLKGLGLFQRLPGALGGSGLLFEVTRVGMEHL